LLKEVLEGVARVGRSAPSETSLTEKQRTKLGELRSKGFATFDDLVGTERMQRLQDEYRDRLEQKLDFEVPVLAQAKIDPERDADLVKSNFLATNAQLAARGLTFDRGDIKNYQQAVEEFQPSTLTTYLPDDPKWFGLWLDPDILAVAKAYMGFTPQLVEAYIRRNYPARFVVMNHAWHRDTNHPTHLLKAFFFLSDCTLKTGPHHYIPGSITDRALDGKTYYSNEEVAQAYPTKKEAVSVVKAGTIILEDTRGLHKAGVPEEGYRDLGYATFLPPIAIMKRQALYKIGRRTYDSLTKQQRDFIPASNIAQ
jgi:hypothetical protein